MFTKLRKMIDELGAAKPSVKKQLLQTYLGDVEFVWMVKMALDQGHSFGIEFSWPPFEANGGTPPAPLKIMQELEELKKGTGVTDARIAELHYLCCTNFDLYYVVTRILEKDLRCGVQAKTVNSVKPGTVFKVPYQRCAGYDRIEKMTGPAMLQRKANGMFAYLLPDGSFMTRNGHRFWIDDNPVSPFIAALPDINDKVLSMELVVLDESGNVMSRSEGNGLINSFLKGTQNKEVAQRVRSFTWGYVTSAEFRAGQGRLSYLQTWQNLSQWLPPAGPDRQPAPIKIIETWFVKDLAEAKAKFFELIAVGEEGGIVKSMSPEFVWRDESSSDFQIKFKAEAEADFRIIDVYAGDPRKKYAGLLGGIRVASNDGLIISDVGGGFTDFDRQLGIPHWEKLIGKIVTVKFNGVTENRDKPGVKALDHPRFIEIRHDKDTDDTLEYCEKMLRGEG